MRQKDQINQTHMQNTQNFRAARGSIPTPGLFLSPAHGTVFGVSFARMRFFFGVFFRPKGEFKKKVFQKKSGGGKSFFLTDPVLLRVAI